MVCVLCQIHFTKGEALFSMFAFSRLYPHANFTLTARSGPPASRRQGFRRGLRLLRLFHTPFRRMTAGRCDYDKSTFIFSFSWRFGQNKDIHPFIFRLPIRNPANFSDLNVRLSLYSPGTCFHEKITAFLALFRNTPANRPGKPSPSSRFRQPNRHVRPACPGGHGLVPGFLRQEPQNPPVHGRGDFPLVRGIRQERRFLRMGEKADFHQR